MTGLYDAPLSEAERRDAFLDGSVPVAVYGLGKMGLPLAGVYAETTGNVLGVDIDESVVRGINRGECHVDREPGLADLVAEQVERGNLRATASADEAAEAAAHHVVIVPTPLTDDRTPDLSALEAVVRAVGSGIDPGDTVVVECTVPPGTCSEVVTSLIREESGLEPGEYGVAFCPERTSSGRALQDIRGSHPKVVGGVDDESTRVAELVYGEITTNEVLPVSDATTAESVKLFEGLYRDVNIALANELARVRDELGIDVNEAIETANTQPFCEIHDPGPGVGGHCIPYYPYFVTTRVESETPLIHTAREVNDSMPEFTVRKVRDELEATGRDVADSTVLVLGLTYRPGVAETAATPAKPIIELLSGFGANVLASDPMLSGSDFDEFDATPVGTDEITRTDPDAVVVVTPHEEYLTLDWTAFEDIVVVDGRDALGETGHRTYTIGSG